MFVVVSILVSKILNQNEAGFSVKWMLLSCCWSAVCLYDCHISNLLGQSCMKWEQIAKCERLSNTLGRTLILVGPGVETLISDLTFGLLNEKQAFQIWKYQIFRITRIELLVNVTLPIGQVWFLSIFWMNLKTVV